jgi:ribonuclease HI
MRRVVLYTDGACEGNPGPGGFAAIIDDGKGRREIKGAEARTTNNRMEMTAVIRGLETLGEPAEVRVVSDSQYVVKGMTQWIGSWRRKGWRTAAGDPVKNRDLWERLWALSERHRVRWEWVRGHDGHPENERADSLAREAIAELADEPGPAKLSAT